LRFRTEHKQYKKKNGKSDMKRRKEIIRGKEAQLFSADMLLAIIIFVMILVSVMWLSDFLNEKIRYDENRRMMGITAGYAMSSLVETPGSPDNWETFSTSYFNETNVRSLGLADKGYGGWQLDTAKVARLSTLGSSKYDEIRDMIGLRGSGYEYYLTISPASGSAVAIGILPEANSTNIIVASRGAMMNSSYTNVSLFLWERCARGCG
jgi:hypothetical protein